MGSLLLASKQWHDRAFCFNRIPLLLMLILFVGSVCHAADERSVSVGMSGRLDQIVLPGSELIAKPIDDQSPIVLRIVRVFPHGTEFRYDLEYYGLEPGEHNLADFLQRKNRSELGDLPDLKVVVTSILPEAQIEPNPPQSSKLPFLGGYRFLIGLGTLLWVVGLVVLVLLKKRKATDDGNGRQGQTVSLADRLRPQVEAAIDGRLSNEQLAELEMTLICFWREQLQWEHVDAGQAVIDLRNHKEAGPLFRQLENWLHRPHQENAPNVEIAKILQPYTNLPADSLKPAAEPSVTQAR